MCSVDSKVNRSMLSGAIFSQILIFAGMFPDLNAFFSLSLQAQNDLASLAFIPLAFLDTALCWWISFFTGLFGGLLIYLELGFHGGWHCTLDTLSDLVIIGLIL